MDTKTAIAEFRRLADKYDAGSHEREHWETRAAHAEKALAAERGHAPADAGEEGYEGMKVDELRAMAADLGLTGLSKSPRADLIAAIESATAPTPEHGDGRVSEPSPVIGTSDVPGAGDGDGGVLAS